MAKMWMLRRDDEPWPDLLSAEVTYHLRSIYQSREREPVDEGACITVGVCLNHHEGEIRISVRNKK